MASQRARLPATPNVPVTTTSAPNLLRHQNIDVQNNTISAMSGMDTFTSSSQIYNNNNINDDALNVLGPDLAEATSQVLENLTDHERSIILDVLSRDESIRQRDAARIMLLRAELHNLRKKGALKTGSSLDRPIIIESNRSCARCRSDLGRIINRGAPCHACRLRVCKTCRIFTNRSDWVCIVCHKQIELQNASGEWMNEVARTPPRRGSITQGFIPTADIIRKSISRSWTISNPEDDQPSHLKNGIDPRIQSNLGHSHIEPSSYPNLIRLNKSPYNSNMDFNNSDNYERTPPTQRRILRQSTLPNPDPTLSSNILKIPVSPKNQQVSPQYSPYHTDNENEPESDATQQPQLRYPIRRQSTLPCKPNDHHTTSKYLSTSPNRAYSRSPDPSAMEGDHNQRYPPFVRQATFPSNTGDQYQYQRQLPTSPNRMSYSKSPDSGGENGQVSPRRFLRQTTLPNPDQHMKLLPTSPPKKSPQFIKRSPEFSRQNTISNPEGMSTLSVHQHGPKFLPISPRQKQNFLFPQPAPRTFLSQQHFPTMAEDQQVAAQPPQSPHSKMIKVRSHSNEEYSFNRTFVPPNPSEGRRLLPEIPNRSRSPSRLVRQDNVKDEGEKRSPILKTFAEAKQTLNDSDYDGHNQMFDLQNSYTSEYSELSMTFAEADENNYNEENDSYMPMHQASVPIDMNTSGMIHFQVDQSNQYHDVENHRYEFDPPPTGSRINKPLLLRNVESFPNETSDYYTPDEYIKQAQKNRNRRRKSRELPADPEIHIIDDDNRRHKPETMRSVSEDSPRAVKIIPRRSFSHPEKETKTKFEPMKIASPKPLGNAEKSAETDQVDDMISAVPKKPVYKFPKMLEMRGDSKSFDTVVRQLIKTDKDVDEKSQSMDDNFYSDKKEHKTTLNEAEIQNAVEQAAGLFKKVVLQRRKERPGKLTDDGDMIGLRREEMTETETKYSYPAEGDDYKLVFISSDSSGKEDDFDDSSSTSSATKCSIIFDDGDWDYFEPSVTAPSAKAFMKDFTSSGISPYGSPNFYRRRFNSSPLSSPLFYRRGASESPLSFRRFRESDTGTDEELLNIESSSPTSSEGFLPEYLKAWKKSHKCSDNLSSSTKKHICKCGKSPHYVAIPVPILVPMDFQNWTNNRNNPDLLQLWNTSNLLYQHNNTTDVINTTASTATANSGQQQQVEEKATADRKDDEENAKKWQKVVDPLSSLSSSAVPSRRYSRNTCFSDKRDNDGSDNNNFDKAQSLNYKSVHKSLRKTSENSGSAIDATTTHLNETIKISSKHESTNTCGITVAATSPCSGNNVYVNNNLIKQQASCTSNAIQATSSGTMISVGKLNAPENGASDGYLVSESVFSSSDEESVDDGEASKSVQRSYDVAGAAQSDNLVVVATTSSDVESHSSSNGDDGTSGSEATDSEDTGIDDRRTKSKRFTKVFVVNKNAPSSESGSCSSVHLMESSSDDETSSDNDTDTDGITLNYIKPLENELTSDHDEHNSDTNQEIVLNYIKPIGEDGSEEFVILNSIRAIDNDFCDTNKQSSSDDSDDDDDEVNVASEKIIEIVDTNNHNVDKNYSDLPSINGTTANINLVIDCKTTDISTDYDSLEVMSALTFPEMSPDGDHMQIDSIDAANVSAEILKFAHDNGKFIGNCNLSMILESRVYDNQPQINDATLPDDNENLLKIESPSLDTENKQQQQHIAPELVSVKLQTAHVYKDVIPLDGEETSFQHMLTTPDVSLLNVFHVDHLEDNDPLEKAPTGNSSNNNTIKEPNENNSCVKQTAPAENCVGSVVSQQLNSADGNGTKFTSLVMITQQDKDNFKMNHSGENVNVISSDTTRIVQVSSNDSIVVQHRNWQPRKSESSGIAGNSASVKSKIGFYEENISKVTAISKVSKLTPSQGEKISYDKFGNTENENCDNDVKVITGTDTLSAVVCLEDGLADDDSWVEELSQKGEEEDEFATTTPSGESSDEMSMEYDREEELRGFYEKDSNKLDFTLHTIIEESCEESDYEACAREKKRISPSRFENYFMYELAGNDDISVRRHPMEPALIPDESSEDDLTETCHSETSSVHSDSLNPEEEQMKSPDTNELATSRLEKYFLSGLLGYKPDGNKDSDGSGSVGSDSEGHTSPEQRRKKLVRARGTGRSHSSSLDNLLAKEDSLESQSEQHQHESDDSSETECDDPYDKTENHSDTVKRKKKQKKPDVEETGTKKIPEVEVKDPSDDSDDEDGRKTPQPEYLMPANGYLVHSRKSQSRDSGFIGSNDDLLKSDGQKSPEMKIELEEIQEEIKETEPIIEKSQTATQSTTTLNRKDSFNAWSSDEETNLMMTKMRQFFKSLLAASTLNTKTSKNTTPVDTPNAGTPKARQRTRPPQLVYFENELTRLMKTVPGIKDEQVRELVEYLSSEDTWSDSYDSSDYTSSDKESAGTKSSKLQQQISASCQEIIEKFDAAGTKTGIPDEEGDMGDGGLLDDPHGINKETAFVYQKLVASITKIAGANEEIKAASDITNSPPLIAKVMHHIGARLVALMHDVSSGESLKSNSPKPAARYHRRSQAKISATTTEDDDSTSESNFEVTIAHNLPRSKSHDLLLDGKPAPDVMTGEEREASDYERFSWRGSFESALLTSCDSRNKLTTLENSTSAMSILAAKRRSAGDLLFNQKSLSREQLDRVRSCGSIGGVGEHDLENSKLWESTQSQESTRRRSGIIEDDSDESDDETRLNTRSTLPRSLQTSIITVSTTNSLPRLPTSSSGSTTSGVQSGAIQKAQSVYQFLQSNVKSARYRAPGFSRPMAPKRALSASGLQQPTVPRRDHRRNKVQSLAMEEIHQSDNASSPVIGNRNVGTLTPKASSSHPATPASATASTDPWPSQSDEDIDRLVAMHQNRHNSLSSLGLRSDSMASVYSGAGEGRYGTVQVKGMVEFGMQYNYKQGALEIHVKQCKDLAAVDTKRIRSDPYVKVYLLPDKTKSGKRKTKVKKHTLNPVFDEVLRFYMSLSSLESRTLWLTVWHSDMFGRNDFLGEVMISLQNKVFDNPQPQWYHLEERSEPFEDVTTYRGDIIVGLKFIPGSESSGSSGSHGLSLRKFSIKSNSSATSASNNGTSGGNQSSNSKNTKGSLHVLVKEAKHLSAVKANGHCDAFCKSYLLPDKNRSSKQKTPVAKRTTSPQWNYTFIYEDVTLAELSERALELTIWDHDRLASNEFLGGVRFSLGTGKHYGRIAEWNDANGKELTLWQSMINRPNFWVEGCLALRSSLENRAGSS